jgi:hypothetical protein
VRLFADVLEPTISLSAACQSLLYSAKRLMLRADNARLVANVAFHFKSKTEHDYRFCSGRGTPAKVTAASLFYVARQFVLFSHPHDIDGASLQLVPRSEHASLICSAGVWFVTGVFLQRVFPSRGLTELGGKLPEHDQFVELKNA